MRKTMIRAILLLLCGAIVNVAVAWGSTRVVKSGYPLDGSAISAWVARLQIQHDMRNARISGGRSCGAVVVTIETYPLAVQAIRAGWPEFALEGTLVLRITPGLPTRATLIATHKALRSGSKSFRLVNDKAAFFPCGILGTGFAINTIFYAVILWVLFFVPGQLRRTLRRRRGLCPACAYPIGTSPVCTECGKQLA